MNKTMYLNSSLVVKGVDSSSEDPTILKIAGYANFSTKDRSQEVILPDAWTKGISNYKKNPVVLFAHDMQKPIGTVTNLKIDSNGLFVDANISSGAEKQWSIQSLIKDGALKTFSVGFIPKKGRKDTSTDTLYITELELLEVSVVSVPMQQDSIFSVVKSLQDQGALEKFMAENVETFDSTIITMAAEDIIVPKSDTTESINTPAVTSTEDPVSSVCKTSLIAQALSTKTKAKIGNQTYKIEQVQGETNQVSLQEISILGNPIGKIFNIDINTLNILNLKQIPTAAYAVLKEVEQRQKSDIAQLFTELVNADIKDVKSISCSNQLVSAQLDYTISLMEKPIKNWNSDDYLVANKIVDFILSRSQLEEQGIDFNNLLLLHGHVEETPEMTQPVENTTDPEVSQVPAVASSSNGSEPRELELLSALETAKKQVEVAQEDRKVSQAALKDLESKVNLLSSQIESQKDKIAAAYNEKVAFNAQHSETKHSRSEVAMAALMALGKTPGQALTLEAFKSTKLGKDILNSTKATITTVDVLITDLTTELYEQMQIELKVAPMLKVMDVDAQHFKLPVADEDTNGDIAMFANGTYNVGETDSTRVPTTRQNVISAVDLTPHKFMGTTHLSKDEQEDVRIPLLDYQVRSLTRRMARTIDKSLLRGDGSLSGFTASPTNAITVGSGYTSVITGLAKLADAASLKVATGGNSTKATPTTIATARALLGRYGLEVGGNNLVYFTSIEGYNDLVTTSDFRTLDKFGSAATYFTGQVGSIYGIPVVVTEFLDVVGVSGNQVGLLVYLPGFIVGRRRSFEVETWYDPRRQLTAVYLSTRFDMKALTTNSNAALDSTKYNMAAVINSNT